MLDLVKIHYQQKIFNAAINTEDNILISAATNKFLSSLNIPNVIYLNNTIHPVKFFFDFKTDMIICIDPECKIFWGNISVRKHNPALIGKNCFDVFGCNSCQQSTRYDFRRISKKFRKKCN